MSRSAVSEQLDRAPVPADGLLHPVALLALGLLVLNDHVLKGTMPSPLTGILSDVAGIVLLPFVLQAGWEMLASRQWAGPSPRAIAVACLATGVGFAAIELLPAAAQAYRYGLGALQWPASAMAAFASAGPLPPLRPVVAVSDPWDLLALAALVIPWSVGRARARRGSVLAPESHPSPTRLRRTSSAIEDPADLVSDLGRALEEA